MISVRVLPVHVRSKVEVAVAGGGGERRVDRLADEAREEPRPVVAHRRRGVLDVAHLERHLVQRAFPARCELVDAGTFVRLDELDLRVGVPSCPEHGGAEPQTFALDGPDVRSVDPQESHQPVDRRVDVPGEDRDMVQTADARVAAHAIGSHPSAVPGAMALDPAVDRHDRAVT